MNQTVSPILLLQKQRALLQMEYDAEKEEFRRQTETLGVRRKVKRGDCWLPLRIGLLLLQFAQPTGGGGVSHRRHRCGTQLRVSADR